MKNNIVIRLEEKATIVRWKIWYETAFGMCIAQVVWNIMFLIS